MTATLPTLSSDLRRLLEAYRAHRASAACRARNRRLVETTAELLGGAVPWAVGAGVLWLLTATMTAWNFGL